jgi:hypothetical protein
LAATALPPPGPGTPSSEVNVPPASATTTEGAAMSHRDSSGSAHMSTEPSATIMYGQKSP